MESLELEKKVHEFNYKSIQSLMTILGRNQPQLFFYSLPSLIIIYLLNCFFPQIIVGFVGYTLFSLFYVLNFFFGIILLFFDENTKIRKDKIYAAKISVYDVLGIV